VVNLVAASGGDETSCSHEYVLGQAASAGSLPAQDPAGGPPALPG